MIRNSINLKIDLREILAIGDSAVKIFNIIDNCMPLHIRCRLQLKNNGIKVYEDDENDIIFDITLL